MSSLELSAIKFRVYQRNTQMEPPETDVTIYSVTANAFAYIIWAPPKITLTSVAAVSTASVTPPTV